MTNEDSNLKDFSGAENANSKTEIEELEGRGSREQIKARRRARNSTADLPGVDA
jgi:hypothetical protein